NFEYAVGHWLQKSAEHVLGCVLCSPGCFSLMRVSYLNNPNVMAMYKSLAQESNAIFGALDQGEDRWLCTLMLFSGGRIEYEGSSHCNTYAPEDLGTFYKQRRRWGPSTTANIWNLVAEQKTARKSNPYISVPYIMYQFTVLVFSLIGVSTTMMMVAEALALGLGGALPRWATYLIVMIPVIIFTFACYISRDGELQLSLATWFSLMFSFLMALVLIGIIIEGVNCPLSPSFLFFAAMAFIHIFGALLHGDIYAIICGVIYFLFIPSCFIFLQIYSIANLNDCSWGTRQAKKADTGIKKTFWQRLCGKSDEEIAKENAGDIDGTNCTCVLCLDPRYEVRIKDEVLDMMRNHGKSPVVDEQPQSIFTPPPAPEPVEKAEPRLTTASVASKGTFLQVDQETRNTINDFLGADDAVPQSMLEHSGFMGTRQTAIIGDETGMNAQYLDPREFDKEIKNERLYGGFQIRKLRQISEDDWQSYMINPKTGKGCYQAKPIGYSEEHTLGDVRDREIKLYKEVGGVNYLSWMIGKNAPFDKRCKVYTLSNPEQTFWETMQDPTDGYIGIRNKGKNFVKIKEHEAWLADEMANFRDEKFMYYIFINVMWIIVSCVILKYSYMLMSIEIPLGDISLPGCGEVVEDESPDEMMKMRGAYFKMMPTNRSKLGFSPAEKDIGIGFPDYGNGNGEDEAQRVLVPPTIFAILSFCLYCHHFRAIWLYVLAQDQVTEMKPTGFEDPEDDETDESTKNITGYGVAATTVAVNFAGDGGGGQDSVKSFKQKKRVTGAAIAATGLLSVPDQDEQGLISNESAFTNYESIKNPYEQMEADRAQGKSNPAFENGEVEMQDLTPTGSDKGEHELEAETPHISIPPLIQMSMEDKKQLDEDFDAQNPYNSPGGTAFYTGEVNEPPMMPPMAIGVSNPKEWVDFMDPAEIRRKVEADKLEVQRKLEEFSAMMLAKDTVRAAPEASSGRFFYKDQIV
ncbi:unnamed protein product, partial [Oikopleura dioica]